MKLTREEFAAMRRGAEHDLQMSAQMPSVLICAGTGCIAVAIDVQKYVAKK